MFFRSQLIMVSEVVLGDFSSPIMGSFPDGRATNGGQLGHGELWVPGDALLIDSGTQVAGA